MTVHYGELAVRCKAKLRVHFYMSRPTFKGLQELKTRLWIVFESIKLEYAALGRKLAVSGTAVKNG